VLRHHAEIVLAHVNRQSSKSAAPALPQRPHSLGRCRHGGLPSPRRMVHTNRSQGVKAQGAPIARWPRQTNASPRAANAVCRPSPRIRRLVNLRSPRRRRSRSARIRSADVAMVVFPSPRRMVHTNRPQGVKCCALAVPRRCCPRRPSPGRVEIHLWIKLLRRKSGRQAQGRGQERPLHADHLPAGLHPGQR
jgi:hypothetical protein